MAISCSPDALAEAAKCLKCLDPGTLRKARARLLAVYAGASTDPQVLANLSASFRGYSPGQLQAMIALLMARAVYPVYYSGEGGGDSYIIPGDPIISELYAGPGASQGSYEYALAATGTTQPSLTWTIPSFLTDGAHNVPGISGTTGDTGSLVFVGGQPRWPMRGFIIQRSATVDNMPSNHFPVAGGAVFCNPADPTVDVVSFKTGNADDVSVSGDWFTNMLPYSGDETWDTIKSYGPQYVDELTLGPYVDSTGVAAQAYAYRAVMVVGPFGIPAGGGTWYSEINWNSIVFIPPQPLANGSCGQPVCRTGNVNTITWAPPAGTIPG